MVEWLAWRTCSAVEWKRLGDWLVARALEHDSPSVPFHEALAYLHGEEIVRPSLDQLLRAVGTARVTANDELYRRLRPVLTPSLRDQLDRLIATDPDLGVAPIVWLNQGATSATAATIKTEIAKLTYLRSIGVDALDMAAVAPERRRQLAGIGRRATPASLRRMAPELRYPILLATVVAAQGEVTDEIVESFSQALGGVDRRARRSSDELQGDLAQADIARLDLLDDILDVIFDQNLDDAAVGAAIRDLDRARLDAATRTPIERLPRDGGHLAMLEARYTQVRSFAPIVLDTLDLAASVEPSEILDATLLLRQLNTSHQRSLPADAPTGFIPTRWQPYLDQARAGGDGFALRHYWEPSLLYGLRDALRSGEIWVKDSRRYANPATYLIPPAEWPQHRPEVLARTGRPATWDEQAERIDNDLDELLSELDRTLASGDGPIKIGADGRLTLSPLPAETIAPAVAAQGDALFARLPRVPLAELLIEVDHATGFTQHLAHAGGASPRHPDLEHRRNLYAALLAQACNFGITRMAELCGISADTLTWTTRWYLREDTLRAANTAIVNAHHRHPLSKTWGGGTLSSSDGLRLPMRGKSLTARALSRYFIDQGITSYTHVSDQHTTYGTQIIVSTERDATYTLDEILGNTTELPIVEHATDTHGQTLLTFALFDLVGLRLSPRIAKLTDRRLWRPHPPSRYQQWPHAGPLLTHHVRTDLIDRHWDDLLRIGGSLKEGHVSASLLISRLQAGTRQHPLAKALLEYGKLLHTTHSLRWFTDEAFRRRIGRQLNRGESINGLRRYVYFAHRGEVKDRLIDDQTTQAHCHTLVTNACILWTTIYLQDAIDAEAARTGTDIPDEIIRHISPARFAHINPYGTYTFDVATILNRDTRRPLRPPR